MSLMMKSAKLYIGGCLCGALRYEAEGEPLYEGHCYCADCRKASAARGKGIGRALIDEVCRRAADVDCKRVYWQTHETNAAAMQLYDKVAEKSGFIV